MSELRSQRRDEERAARREKEEARQDMEEAKAYTEEHVVLIQHGGIPAFKDLAKLRRRARLAGFANILGTVTCAAAAFVLLPVGWAGFVLYVSLFGAYESTIGAKLDDIRYRNKHKFDLGRQYQEIPTAIARKKDEGKG